MLPKKQQSLRGAGTGKASSSTRPAFIAPDNLRSISYARVIDLISEGEIEGFVDRNGVLLINAVAKSVGVHDIGGVHKTITSVELYPVSSGYPIGPFDVLVTDKTGSGAKLLGFADDPARPGVVNRIQVKNGGKDYSSKPNILIPSVIGKAVTLNGNNLQNLDLTYNYDNVTIVTRHGTQNQTVMGGFDQAQRVVYADGQEFKHSSDVFVEIDDPTIDALTIGVNFPALFNQNVNNGDISGIAVIFNIYLTYDPPSLGPSSEEILLYQETVNGKASQGFLSTRTVDIRFTKDDGVLDHHWTLRANRSTQDFTNQQNIQAKSELAFITGITYAPLSYPNSALVGIEVNASQFTSIPARAYRVRLLRIQVPTNYFPETRTYNRAVNDILDVHDTVLFAAGDAVVDANGKPVDQIWDGSFYTAWSSNPAWCFYDLATNPRYGLGQFIDQVNVDKWTLYQIARYSDELVPDGVSATGLEPRFTCNVYIQTRQEAYKVLQDMASVFRGVLFWASGTIVATQDAPAIPVAHFTVANVKDGMFNYSGTARKTRHTVALVRWNDPADDFKSKSEYVEDIQGIVRFGIRELDIAAFGTTSRGQAHRVGRMALYSERHQTETVVFRTGMEALIIRPGDIINVSDNNRSGAFFGGRILRISDDRMTIFTDRPKKAFDDRFNAYMMRTVGSIQAAHLRVMVFTPTIQVDQKEIVDSTEIEQIRSTQLTDFRVEQLLPDEIGNLALKLSDVLPSNVDPGTVWGLTSLILAPQQFRVVGITEISKYEFEITGLQHSPNKYLEVEQNLFIEDIPTSILPDQYSNPETPRGLKAVLEDDLAKKQGIFRIDVSWTISRSGFVKEYEVYMREGNNNFFFKTSTESNQVEIDVTMTAEYVFRVIAIGLTGNRSAPAEVGIFVDTGGATGEEKITGLELVNQANDTIFRGRDAIFGWRVNSPINSYDIGSEPNGGNSGGPSPDFIGYEVKIHDPTLTVTDVANPSYGFPLLLKSDLVQDPLYAFKFDDNASTDRGPHRNLTIEVTEISVGNKRSRSEEIRVNNPHPIVPTVLADTTQTAKLVLQFASSSNTDRAGYRVWVSTVNGFDPTVVTPVYEGSANPVTVSGLSSGTTYYYRYAEYDVFSSFGEYALMSSPDLTAAISTQHSFVAA